MWQNVIVRRGLSKTKIAHGFARVFGVAPESVAVAENLLEHPDYQPPTDCQILVDRVKRGGEFAVELTAIIHGARAEAVAREEPVDVLVGHLSGVWGADILISGSDSNPYEWRLIGPDGRVQTVSLNAEQLDEHGRFVIVPVPSASEAA